MRHGLWEMLGNFKKNGEPTTNRLLVGGWTKPFEKYAHQIGTLPQKIGVKIPKMFETTT